MDRSFHPDDIVQKKANEKHVGVVERTHGDVDTHEPRPGRNEPESITRDKDVAQAAFKKFMRDGVPPRGIVMVRWQHTPSAQLIPESKLTVLDRSLLIGDVVKRGANDAMSGVVINTFAKCTLQPLCDLSLSNNRELKGILPPTGTQGNSGIREARNGRPPPLVDIPACELKFVEAPSEEDVVTYRDWIGRVDSVQNAITLKLTDGCVVEIIDESAEHVDGMIDAFFVGDVAETKKGRLRTGRWIYGQYNPNTAPIGTVVETRVVSAEISWLQKRIGSSVDVEPPVVLERDELDSSWFRVYNRCLRPAGISSGDYQTLSNSDVDLRLGLRVRFNDLAGASLKYDGSDHHGKLPRIDRKDSMGYDINVFDVVNFSTEVTVQWQDLSMTREKSVDLVPEHSLDDEHAAWPGEIVHTLDLEDVSGEQGLEQPSRVGVVQSVMSQERMVRIKWSPDARVVYSKDEDHEAGPQPLVMGVVGKAAGEAEELSLYDVESPATMNVRRGDIVLMSDVDGRDLGGEVNWLGEIVDTKLDGTLVVRLGAASPVEDITVNREAVVVAIRSDGTDDLGDGWQDNDGGMDIEGGESTWDEDMEALVDYSEDDFDSDDEEEPAFYEDENGQPIDEEDMQDWESDDGDEDEEMADAPQQTPPTSLDATPPTTNKQDEENADLQTSPVAAPEPYLILDAPVPSTHHYYNEPATENSLHMKRLSKEHKILRSPGALPPGVYVRTWDSRLDLLRVLFIGPAETPYADAPFIMDFYLPSTFPTDPPLAHFHSWPAESGLGGVGRVNPNLYEDGKICLSLLGTWDGNKSEGWSAARSTLLQVIVSLLGLVLVREPYFNEAGYEPLAGLESSRRPSAVYNERVFLRAKTFVIAASRRVAGVEGLEDVLHWLYRGAEGPRLLERTVESVRAVLERSEARAQETDGLTVMSKGACIPLRRVLGRLEAL